MSNLNPNNQSMNYYNDVEKRIKEYQPKLENREELYTELHREEIQERKQAELNRDIVEAYDALCDMVRTAYGVRKEFGDHRLEQLTEIMRSSHYIVECFEECREEVKKSNRTKSKEAREDWKILKGENYKAPDLKPIIKRYHLHCNI